MNGIGTNPAERKHQATFTAYQTKRADALALTVTRIRDLCTGEHESKQDFIDRVSAVLSADPDKRLELLHGGSLTPRDLEADILFWAFRYALGRQTYAVSDVTQSIRHAWAKLSPKHRALIKKEIRQAQERDGLGNAAIDAPDWLGILNLPDEM
jgi:hypothetical protein